MQQLSRIATFLILAAASFAQQRPAPTIPRQPIGPGPSHSVPPSSIRSASSF